MLGLPKGDVFLVPWTAEWAKEFAVEKEKIQKEIGGLIEDIHHIGSTAVKGLRAKPIIDIAIEVKHFNDGKYCVLPLEKLGYSYKGLHVLPDRYYFNKGEPRTHQIHMYQTGNRFLMEQLRFRDYLRSDDDVSMQYENVKIQLAKAYTHHKHAYAEGKTAFIQAVLRSNE